MSDVSREALERLRKHLALLDEQAMTWTGHDYDISRLLALVEQQEKALREIESSTHQWRDWWGCEESAQRLNALARAALGWLR